MLFVCSFSYNHVLIVYKNSELGAHSRRPWDLFWTAEWIETPTQLVGFAGVVTLCEAQCGNRSPGVSGRYLEPEIRGAQYYLQPNTPPRLYKHQMRLN